VSVRSARVVGDGPAGLVAALALAGRGWRVTIEAAGSGRRRRMARIDVLAGSALPVLARLGIPKRRLLRIASPCPGRWTRWGGEAHAVDYVRSLRSAWAVDRPGFDRLLAERAAEVGVRFAGPGDASSQGYDPSWTILATGGGEATRDQVCDDRLIALVCSGPIDRADGEADTRLMVEACPEGWAYGVSRGGTQLCLGVVTDAQALRGDSPRAFAARLLGGTDRIGRLMARFRRGFSMQGFALSCRLCPLLAAERRLRVGDARMVLDPLAGRGLWQAVYGTERVVALLDETPDALSAHERSVNESYADYLRQRRAFYRGPHDSLHRGFWVRRGSVRG
jgi:2-polyprenyl-6-methoxyphenol hydroxylase-like FAD-dependent oxidoreductase